MPALIRAALLAWSIGCLATPAPAQDAQGWYELEVPGGRATLDTLGVADSRERSAVMVELTRRFLFATTSQTALEISLRNLPAGNGSGLTVPLPLAPEKWAAIVFGKPVSPSRLFAAILLDPGARLLFHGLAGLDLDTRRWMEGQDDLLRRLYRNRSALKSFALFAPAFQVTGGRVELPGGSPAEQRWFATLGIRPDQPARFVSRLFEDREGRTAGLFAAVAFADEARQRFLLTPTPSRFGALVSRFAECYPAHSNDYPFALRSHDAALLVLELRLTVNGEIAGPTSRRFWEGVFAHDDLSRGSVIADLGGDAIDAAWLVDRLCDAPASDRAAVFATMLAGPRVFRGLHSSEWADAVIALRVRRLFPSLFMAMERGGVVNPATFAAVGRHALKLDRLTDLEGAATALRQFQGALALVLNAAGAKTFGSADTDRLLESLSEVAFARERYDGGIAAWITREWLPAVRRALILPADVTAEQVTAAALAGPPPAHPPRVHWEGVDYVLDFPAAARHRLRDVRARQGGLTLDAALAAAVDAQLAQVLASWAYAPHVGTADSGALVGGDGSARHDLGLRSVNRTRFEQRWEVAATAGERGVIAGSYLGLVAPLAGRSLRRLASDRIPPPPTIADNDLASLFLTAALSDPNALTDEIMTRITASIVTGTQRIADAGSNPDRITAAARSAAMSPWRRVVLPWVIAEEPARLAEQFTLTHRARLGGLRPADADPWGSAALVMGCLCLRMPEARIPELVAGRPADGIVGGESTDLMLRIATLLSELRLPAALAAPVLSYAMRDFVDAVRPTHAADFAEFARQAPLLDRTTVEDYIGAIAAVGALRPVVRR